MDRTILFSFTTGCAPGGAGTSPKGDVLMRMKNDVPNIACNFDPCATYAGANGPACCPKKSCQEAKAVNQWILTKAHPAFATMVGWAGPPQEGRRFCVGRGRSQSCTRRPCDHCNTFV